MQRVFVTGGSGFIGAHLIPKLIARGIEVKAMARSDRAASVLNGLGATTFISDLSSRTNFGLALDGVDTVFHLAAARRVFDAELGRSERPGSPELLGGTRDIVDGLKAGGARLIVTSSTSVYGRVSGHTNESAPVRPVSSYGRYRVDAENLCRQSFAQEPGRLVIARLTEVYGPGGVGHIRLFSEIAQGQFRLIGDGRALHHMSAVEDVVDGLIACAEISGAGGKTMNLGSPPRRLGEIVNAAAKAAQRAPRTTPWLQPAAQAALNVFAKSAALRRVMPGVYGVLDYQVRSRAFDMAASRECLGDYARASFEETIASAVRAAVESRAVA